MSSFTMSETRTPKSGLVRQWQDCKRIQFAISLMLHMPGWFILHYIYSTPFEWRSVVSNDFLPLLSRIVAFSLSFLVILLPTCKVLQLYAHCLAMTLIFTEDYFALQTQQLDGVGSYLSQGNHQKLAIISHWVVIVILCHLMEYTNYLNKLSIWMITVVPIAAQLFYSTSKHYVAVHTFSSTIMFCVVCWYSTTAIPKMSAYLDNKYSEFSDRVNLQGLGNTMAEFWDEILYYQLLLYWALCTTYQIYLYNQDSDAFIATVEEAWYILTIHILAINCGSIVGVLAFAAVIMLSSRVIHRIARFIVQDQPLLGSPVSSSVGISEAVTVVLLAAQFGLTGLPMPARMVHTALLLFIALGITLQSLRDMTEPVLLSVGASNYRPVGRHIRVLLLSVFLLVFSSVLSVAFIRAFSLTFWSTLVVSSVIITSFQQLSALCMYSLFMYDAHAMNCNWELLDESIYSTRAFFRGIETFIAVLIGLAGCREVMLSKNWPLLSSLSLVIHLYVNVYAQLQASWLAFMARLEAAHKVEQLPWATESQLQARSQDVCPICLVSMVTARVTTCGHLYHQHCIKKWLYVQDRCPLCSESVSRPVDS